MKHYTTPTIPTAEYAKIQSRKREIPKIKKDIDATAKNTAEQIFYFESLNLPKQERQELNQFVQLIEIMIVKAFKEGYIRGKYEAET